MRISVWKRYQKTTSVLQIDFKILGQLDSCLEKKSVGASKMVQQVKEHAAMPGTLSSTSRTHGRKREMIPESSSPILIPCECVLR